MVRSRRCAQIVGSSALVLLARFAWAQEPTPPRDRGPGSGETPPSKPSDGPGGPGGFGGFGGVREDMKLVEPFDKDADKRLNAAERKAAREFLAKERAAGRGPRGPGGPGGRGGRGGFGAGRILAPQIVSQADKDGDQKLTQEEFTGLADAWFDKLDPGATGKLSQEQFAEKLGDVLPPPQGFGGPGGGPPGGGPGGGPDTGPDGGPGTGPGGGPGTGPDGTPGGGPGFGPGRFLGPGLFAVTDSDKDGSLTRSELKATFGKWFTEWDSEKSGSLNEEKIRTGLSAALPRPSFGGPGGPGGFGGPGGPGGPGFRGRNENREPPRPGPKLSPAEVESFPEATLYAMKTLRTFFLEFENADWEKELADFHGTDVEVPAKLVVDGKTYPDVGVHFRGMSSFMMVGEGRKRSLNLSLDFVNEEQRIGGYRTLNLLNSHEDPTFLRAVLYCQIARQYVPAPNANFVRVVINGESWGVYINAQQFNKDFAKDWFGTTKGARWKVPGSPGGRGSLAYLGDDVAQYKDLYELKTKDDPKAWADFVRLCKVLNETPADKLEEALSPLLDVDGALKFLALENVLINNDGYWIRSSDYNIYQDEKGRFHIVPYDANETFALPGGPGFGSGPGGPGGPGGRGSGRGPRVNGVELDPLVAANDAQKPLLSKLLAVPSLRSRYLGHVRDIAEKWLDWSKLGPLVDEYQSLIAGDVKSDTRKLSSTEDFTKGIAETAGDEGGPGGGGPEGSGGPGGFRGRGTISLKTFVEKRRAFLLDDPEVKKAGK